MKREQYFNFIYERLSFLAFSVKMLGKLNLHNINIHCENFYRDLFNILFGFKLVNVNSDISNYEAIDLIDNDNKIVIQVSSQKNKNKIEDALSKPLIASCASEGYTFKYICLIEYKTMKEHTYNNPNGIMFDPNNDCYDFLSLISLVKDLELEKLEILYCFISDQLSFDNNKIYSDLAYVVRVIDSDWSIDLDIKTDIPFEVENKIAYNKLEPYEELIRCYSYYSQKLNELYFELDKIESRSETKILNTIKTFYVKSKTLFSNSTDLFDYIVDKVKEYVKNSRNFDSNAITEEGLLLSVNIIVIDAFLKCKIFENPEGYHYVVTK